MESMQLMCLGTELVLLLELETLLRLVGQSPFLEVEGHVVLGNLAAVTFHVHPQDEIPFLVMKDEIDKVELDASIGRSLNVDLHT